jgi:hypothetical protein
VFAFLEPEGYLVTRFDSFRVVELDFDFVAYAGEHFSRMERTAAEPRFKTALTPSDRNE